MTIKSVKTVDALDGYRVKLAFTDGVERVVDLEPKLRGEIFEPLRDPAYFRQVYVEDGTIRWPNGADFIPKSSTMAVLRRGRRPARASAAASSLRVPRRADRVGT